MESCCSCWRSVIRGSLEVFEESWFRSRVLCWMMASFRSWRADFSTDLLSVSLNTSVLGLKPSSLAAAFALEGLPWQQIFGLDGQVEKKRREKGTARREGFKESLKCAARPEMYGHWFNFSESGENMTLPRSLSKKFRIHVFIWVDSFCRRPLLKYVFKLKRVTSSLCLTVLFTAFFFSCIQNKHTDSWDDRKQFPGLKFYLNPFNTFNLTHNQLIEQENKINHRP